MNLPRTLMAQRVEALPARTDAFPQGIDYPDRGCAVGGPTCLGCPLARCVHDAPSVKVARISDRRERILARVSEGATIADVMREFGLSRRTVQRDIYGA